MALKEQSYYNEGDAGAFKRSSDRLATWSVLEKQSDRSGVQES